MTEGRPLKFYLGANGEDAASSDQNFSAEVRDRDSEGSPSTRRLKLSQPLAFNNSARSPPISPRSRLQNAGTASPNSAEAERRTANDEESAPSIPEKRAKTGERRKKVPEREEDPTPRGGLGLGGGGRGGGGVGGGVEVVPDEEDTSTWVSRNWVNRRRRAESDCRDSASGSFSEQAESRGTAAASSSSSSPPPPPPIAASRKPQDVVVEINTVAWKGGEEEEEEEGYDHAAVEGGGGGGEAPPCPPQRARRPRQVSREHHVVPAQQQHQQQPQQQQPTKTPRRSSRQNSHEVHFSIGSDDADEAIYDRPPPPRSWQELDQPIYDRPPPPRQRSGFSAHRKTSEDVGGERINNNCSTVNNNNLSYEDYENVVLGGGSPVRKISGGILKNSLERERSREMGMELQDLNQRPRQPSGELILAVGTPVETIREDISEDRQFTSPYRNRKPSRDRLSSSGLEGSGETDAEMEEILQGPGMTLSDEEFQENYLGNIPANKRKYGVFPPEYRSSLSIQSSPGGAAQHPPIAAASKRYRRSVSESSSKRISFDFTNQGFANDEMDDYPRRGNHFSSSSNASLSVSNSSNDISLEGKPNGLRSFGSSPDIGLNERFKRARRFSQTSLDTLGSRASLTGSDISLSRTVAAHVRRDSIAMFSDKLNSNPLKKTSLKIAADLGQLRKAHIHMSKKEILKKYRLHIAVGFIFIFTLLFVSLGWYYRDKTEREDAVNQKIFIDPRKRVLTLSDGYDKVDVLVGQNLPQWQLPLHCPVHTDGNPNSKECTWKNNAVLRVRYFVATAPDRSTKGSAECYRVSWETLQLPRVPYDCFHVGNALWYGPSNQSAETFPVRGQFDYVPTPYQLSNSGVFSSVADLYWLSSSGVGLLLNANDPLTVHWNTTVADHMCVVSNYSGPLYGRANRNALPHMNYTICNGPDPLTTHLIMKNMLRGTREPVAPSNDMFSAPQWSVSDITRKTDYDEYDVMDIVAKMKKHGLNCSLLMLDGDWQRNHGDLTFDSDRFANLTNMTDSVHGTCNLALQVSPYFDYRSLTNFHNGVDQQLFVKDAGGEVPGLIRWQNGPAAAMLDVSSVDSRTWFKSLITPLFNRVAEGTVRAVRLSYGSKGWLPYRPTFSDDTSSMSLHKLRRQTAELMSGFTSRLVLEHTSGSQSLPGLVPVRTDIDVRDGRSCLVNAVEKALTLGLLGYPYVLADGFSVPKGRQTSFLSSPPSQDLFTRWMQMAAFFPAYKFSVAPWIYDAPSSASSSSSSAGGHHPSSVLTTVNIARNLSRLHSELILKAISSPELQKDVVEKGLPILRPVWWVDSGNGEVHQYRLHDEFLVGDSLLVAPVLCEGVTKRSIYVPRGVWSDGLRKKIVLGPTVLRDYLVELHEVPYFLRMRTHNEAKQ